MPALVRVDTELERGKFANSQLSHLRLVPRRGRSPAASLNSFIPFFFSDYDLGCRCTARERRAVRSIRTVRACPANAAAAAPIIQTATATLQNAARSILNATATANAAPSIRCVTAIAANAARCTPNATARASAAVVIRSVRVIFIPSTASTSAAHCTRIVRVFPNAIIADTAIAPNTAVSVEVI